MRSLAALAALFALAIPSLVRPWSTGISPPGGARSLPACGACHNSVPGVPPGVQKILITLAPSARSLTLGQAISITTTATGGQPASPLGGFFSEVVGGGALSAGANTRIWNGGAAIGHQTQVSRSWTYGYTAPASPGLLEMYVVVNTVDGSGVPDGADWWGFHAFDTDAGTSTPVRLYANAVGVSERGAGCAGGYGNWPVLGAKETPSVGNASFAFEVHGTLTGTPVGLAIGFDPAFPGIDLTLAGIPGCTLRVNTILVLPGATGPGDPVRGDGVAILPLPIPSDPSLQGKGFEAQVAILDVPSGRPIPITMTNALDVVIQ